jgi:D-sedoheptulose 7-phosphate isomerase
MDEQQLGRAVEDSLRLKRSFFDANLGRILDAGRRIAASLVAGGRLLTFGNGGSAADAQHFAAELVGRFQRERRSLSAIALTTDPSIVTALGNDYGFERVFSRQIQAHGRAGDIAFGITTSGRSPNVVAGLREARGRGLLTIGLTGRGGGDVAAVSEILIDVPGGSTQRIQEVHAMVVHLLCEVVEDSVPA